jgi:hypothetical protein
VALMLLAALPISLRADLDFAAKYIGAPMRPAWSALSATGGYFDADNISLIAALPVSQNLLGH